MRFILGFIFFGLLFYAIYYFFPEAFQTLVSWAGNVFDFFKSLFKELADKFNTKKEAAPVQETVQTILFFFPILFSKRK